MENKLEILIERWEFQRSIKNLMGKYSNMIILNREGEIFKNFWSNRGDNCLAFNDGYYKGKAVEKYYKSVEKRNALVAVLLQKKFPDKIGKMSTEEIYGIGPFKVKPLSSPVIEIAEDGETAKGLWYCQGACNEIEESGPVARWTWGYFAVDFMREEDEFKIWHLCYFNDVDCISGTSWGKPEKKLPILEEFAILKDFSYENFSKEVCLYEKYHVNRKLAKIPKIPEPYNTFKNTFSYGY